jgi:hypothetical protein
MTQDKLDLLKSQLPISFNITMSMDYPNGIQSENATVTNSDNSIGRVSIKPEYSTLAKVSGTIGQYGVILTWKYLEDPDNIHVDYCGYSDGDEIIIPILQLKEFLLKLKG